MEFIKIAKYFRDGNFSDGLKHSYHPLYPLLISLVSIPGIGFEISGRLISVFFGMLSVITVYIFGKKIFEPQVAFVSALLLAFQPYAVRYSANVWSDPTYSFFYLLGFGLGYMAIVSKKSGLFFLAGMASACAYLTRPEGISIILIVSFWMIVQLVVGFGKSAWRGNLNRLCLLLAGFLILSAPYIIYLKHHTHAWTLTQKKQISNVSGINMLWNTHGDNQFFEDASYSQKGAMDDLVDAGKGESSSVGSVHGETGTGGNSPLPDSVSGQSSGRKYFESFYKVLNTLVITQQYPFLLFLIVGVIHTIKIRENKKVNFYILSYISLFLIILYFLKVTSGYVDYRHLMNVVMVMLFWTGMGVSNTYNWLMSRVPKRQKYQAGKIFSRTGVVFLCVVVASILPKTLRSSMDQAIYMDAGIWIKTFYADVPSILTSDPRVIYYTNSQWIETPVKSSYDEVLKLAKQNNVSLIVVTENITRHVPDFFLRLNDNDVKELLALETKNRKVIVYKVL